MHTTNGSHDICDERVFAINLNSLLFHFFALPHFANRRACAISR
ncbi:MAG: hypothetical protein RLZZ26_671 [Candidatus Parcubacteria bacterium]